MGGSRYSSRSSHQADYAAIARDAARWLALAWSVLMAPFRLIAAVGRFCFATGVGLYHALMKVLIGILGLAFILFVGNGLLHVVLYPLFHR